MSFTATEALQNSSASVSFIAAQAANNIDYDKADEKVVIVARNENDTAGMTATISVCPGDFMHSGLGTLSVTIAYNNAMKVIGPLESMRFKNSAGHVVANVAVAASGTASNVKLAIVELP